MADPRRATSPFYAALGEYYDEIFPLDGDMADFLSRHLPRGPALDIGCATGSLALLLAASGFTVHGCDLDPGMIAAAEARARAADLPASFAVRDMRAVAGAGAPGSFAAAYCVGNTLVHLASLEETGELLQAVHGLLKPGGMLALQIINYDRVLDCGVSELPALETGRLRFERFYRSLGGRLEFRTRLTVKDTAVVHENSIPLYPLRAAMLTTALATAGFSAVRLFADFSDAPWTPDGYLTVALARA